MMHQGRRLSGHPVHPLYLPNATNLEVRLMDIFQIIVVIAGAAIVGALFYGSYYFAREEWADKSSSGSKGKSTGVPAE